MADYPITSVARRIVYTGSAGVGPYSFSFPVIVNTDIAVYKNDALLTLTTDYTVTISGTTGQGSVTLVVAATGADRITIVGARPIERSTDFVTGGDFFANTLNTELDSDVIFVQQVAETAERSLKAPVTDPTSINMTLPYNTTRANKFLSFDADGNPTVTNAVGTYKGNWAASTAYIVYDIIKDTSNNNIYICLTAHTSTGSQPISSNADVAKWSLLVDAASATTSATAAAASASAASTSATNAASSASAASTSATNAATSASTATTQASNASTSASNASTSATAASGSATTASTQASNASTSATASAASAAAASTSATSASGSASTATTQASNASTSASAASTSASNASTSATASAASASTATTQATTATTQASNASTSATAAAASAAAALAAADNFDDTYLGAFSSNPTLDNDGNALTTGDLYFNTVANELRVYNGTTWQAAALTAASFLTVSNNLSDLASNSTARTNLGLGTVATESTVPVTKGGTGNATATAYAVQCGGTTSTGAHQSVASVGTTGQVLTSNGASTLPTFQTIVSGATLSNDTSTASNLYPLFAAATSGTPTTIYTSNSNYLYKPSTGDLQAKQVAASNGIFVNNMTIGTSYTIPSGYGASSVGAVTISSGVVVTIPSGSRWVVL